MAGRRRAVVIGAGFGGLSMGIRLQSLGYDTTIVDKLDGPGGRGFARRQDGFTFDMGPTVLTVPHFLEELFALERDRHDLFAPDFPEGALTAPRVESGVSGGPATSRYVEVIPLVPFYRIWFPDGTFFDYDGDPERTEAQIRKIAPEDLDGYRRFHAAAQAIFARGFLELGYTHFDDVGSMLAVAPELLRLDAVRSLFGFVSSYFSSPKLRQVFSFETLLIGGSPLRVPAIYAMIHFVEKTWGIHFAKGGTGALVEAFAQKFRDLGGTIRYGAEAEQIIVVPNPKASLLGRKGVAKGVLLKDGTALPAEVVVSNADYAHTYLDLIEPRFRRWHAKPRIQATAWSMSVVVVYFGFTKRDGEQLELLHHNILLGPRYEPLLREIFVEKRLGTDFSVYLHLPTVTDPSLAPEGCHAAYALVPVPHNGSGIDWSKTGDRFVDTVLASLERHIPDLRRRIVSKSFITPDHFEGTMNSWLGNAFGIEPVLVQSAWFRPHNRSEDVEGLYLVGASTQPGAGTPSVMMSAKMTARAILEDVGTGLVEDAAPVAAR